MEDNKRKYKKVERLIDVDENDPEKIDVSQNHVNRDSENEDEEKDRVVHVPEEADENSEQPNGETNFESSTQAERGFMDKTMIQEKPKVGKEEKNTDHQQLAEKIEQKGKSAGTHNLKEE